jgi:hypothetical protein
MIRFCFAMCSILDRRFLDEERAIRVFVAFLLGFEIVSALGASLTNVAG